MIRYLLDTNIISEPAKPKPDKNVLEKCVQHNREMAISSIVWHELIVGLVRLPEGRKRNYLAHYLWEVVVPSVPVLPYNAIAAEWHGKERVRLEETGRTPAFSDSMVAAVAASAGLILVTRNVNDFENFDGLKIENWFEF